MLKKSGLFLLFMMIVGWGSAHAEPYVAIGLYLDGTTFEKDGQEYSARSGSTISLGYRLLSPTIDLPGFELGVDFDRFGDHREDYLVEGGFITVKVTFGTPPLHLYLKGGTGSLLSNLIDEDGNLQENRDSVKKKGLGAVFGSNPSFFIELVEWSSLVDFQSLMLGLAIFF